MNDPCREPLPDDVLGYFEGEVLLRERLREFTAELRQLLIDAEEPDLALQCDYLWITNRCRCGDDFCSAFDVHLRSQLPTKVDRESGYRCIDLQPKEGIIAVEVHNGEIFNIEALYREDVKKALEIEYPR